MAEFIANDVKIQAELSTGHIVTCTTSLKAEGAYREWYEPAPCEWMYGHTESEADIDENTIEVLYPDEFEADIEYMSGSKITKVLQLLEEPEWEVQEGWNDYDSDRDYDTWKDRQIA